jgi:predicted amidophosphoribosyltransferase
LLCAQCESSCIVSPGEILRELHGGPLAGFRGSELNVNLVKLLSAVKDQQQLALVEQLAPRFVSAVDAWLTAGSTILVPMPTSASRWRQRGFNLPQLLARLVSRDSAHLIEVADCLRFARKVGDQRALSAHDRGKNLRESMAVKPDGCDALIARFRAAGHEPQILLIDDVITTGSTMTEAIRALASSGIRVDGFLVFAETLLKTPTQLAKWV